MGSQLREVAKKIKADLWEAGESMTGLGDPLERLLSKVRALSAMISTALVAGEPVGVYMGEPYGGEPQGGAADGAEGMRIGVLVGF